MRYLKKTLLLVVVMVTTMLSMHSWSQNSTQSTVGGSDPKIEFLDKNGCKMRIYDETMPSAVYFVSLLAARPQDTEMMNLILSNYISAGCSQSETDSRGYTALHMSVLNNQFYWLKRFLEAGADPMQKVSTKDLAGQLNAFDILDYLKANQPDQDWSQVSQVLNQAEMPKAPLDKNLH